MDIAALHVVSEEFASYLSEVTDGDLTAHTPCPPWTIDDLYHHMLDLNIQFSQVLDRQSAPFVARDECGSRESIYRDSARHATELLVHATESTSRGALSLPDAVEWHLTNTLVHTWDLAQATGMDFDPPRPDVLDITLACLRRLPPDGRGPGKPFAAIPRSRFGSPMEEVLLLSGRDLS